MRVLVLLYMCPNTILLYFPDLGPQIHALVLVSHADRRNYHSTCTVDSSMRTLDIEVCGHTCSRMRKR